MARSAPWRPICTTMQTFAHSHLASSHAGTSVLPMSPAPRDDPVSCWTFIKGWQFKMVVVLVFAAITALVITLDEEHQLGATEVNAVTEAASPAP
ncbi:MAG: hypothetical protein WDW38_000450 [Sanguina aurantia]